MYEANFPATSNRADWVGTIELVNDDTDEVIADLTGVSFVLEVRERLCRTPRLSATFDNGKASDLGNGVIEWHFLAAEMGALCAGSYEIGITVSRDDFTEQELIGVLPIVDGVVRR